MIKQIFVCDVCLKEKDFMAERSVYFGNKVILNLGHVCFDCAEKIEDEIEKSIRQTVLKLCEYKLPRFEYIFGDNDV